MAAERPIAARFEIVAAEIRDKGRLVTLVRCMECAALVEMNRQLLHVRWHDALAVRAVAGEDPE